MRVAVLMRVAEWPPVGKELFILFTVRIFRGRLSLCMCASFPIDFEGAMLDLIVLVPDHCLSFQFS